MFLGLHAFERESPQRVLVSARIEVGGTDWAAGWAAGRFFDYDHLAGHIRSFAGQHIDTQEELAARIHGFITAQPDVKSAEVTTRKPDIFADAKSVGVIFRG